MKVTETSNEKLKKMKVLVCMNELRQWKVTFKANETNNRTN